MTPLFWNEQGSKWPLAAVNCTERALLFRALL
jgi:hypothetical protein